MNFTPVFYNIIFIFLYGVGAAVVSVELGGAAVVVVASVLVEASPPPLAVNRTTMV